MGSRFQLASSKFQTPPNLFYQAIFNSLRHNNLTRRQLTSGMADSDHIEETTPRAASSFRQPSVHANNNPQASGLRQMVALQLKRWREYAEQLRPMADKDLPPALRDGRKYFLHYGFECPMPPYEGDESVEDPDARAIAVVGLLRDKIEQVNEETKPKKPRLKPVDTVTDAARQGDIMLFALYSTRSDPMPQYTEAEIERVRDGLRKAFGTVEGPMWHFDEMQHGASAHCFQPFEQAYPCHPITMKSTR